jgi:hypothetical protein
VAVASVMALGAVGGASAHMGSARVALSGGTYHVAACPGPVLAGRVRCFARIVTDRTGRVLENRFAPNVLESTAGANVVPAGFGPKSLILAYNPGVAATYPAGVGSPGTIVAIVDAFGYTNAERDLNVYRTTFHLGPCTTANGCFTKYNQNGVQGSYPADNVGWAQETALDLDMASAMCPHCKIMLVESNSDFTNSLAAAVKTAVVKGAHVVSNSYGGPECGSACDANAAYNHAGVAITASTGDEGYNDHEDPPPHGAESPASSQYVTAVGGTSLHKATNARGWTETAWRDGGSGCSKFYPKPAWQHDTLCTKRMEADISAVADPTSKTNSSWQVYGGTSVSAPLVGGIYGAKGGTVTRGSLYAAGVHLNDVTTGANGSCGGTYFCTARAGYDGPTGLGTPHGTAGF